MLISLKQLNQRLFNTPLIDYPYGLAHGKMGLIIYLYHLWSYTNDTNYKDRAELKLRRSSSNLALSFLYCSTAKREWKTNKP